MSVAADARLVLAPRRPERFDEVAALLRRAGLRFWRRSAARAGDTWPTDAQILLLDTLGELAGLYAGARVAFVGGTLAPRGGHNVLEPAAFGVPVIFGPSTDTTRVGAERLRAADGAVEVRNASELAESVERLFADRAFAEAMGRRRARRRRWQPRTACGDARDRPRHARVHAARGDCAVTARGAKLATRVWERSHAGWDAVHRLLTPASALYGGTVAVRNFAYRRGLLGARRVDARTISVGNLRIGGTGKTPLTRWLAEEARARGVAVAIVSRGYGGSEREAHVVGDATRVVSDVTRSGDETVMLARTAGCRSSPDATGSPPPSLRCGHSVADFSSATTRSSIAG